MFVTISVIAALSFMSDHPFDQGSRESVLNSEFFLSWQGMLQDSWQLPAALFLRTKKVQTLVSAQPGSYAVIERRPLTPGRGVFLLPCFFPAHMGGWGSSVAGKIVMIHNRQKREGGGGGK